MNENATILRIALALQKITSSDEMCDRIIATYEAILKKGDKFSLKDAVNLEIRLDKKHARIKLKK